MRELVEIEVHVTEATAAAEAVPNRREGQHDVHVLLDLAIWQTNISKHASMIKDVGTKPMASMVLEKLAP